jgi:hypothetical protein
MHYLLSVIDDTTNSATPAEMTAIDAFNAQLVADGRLVFAGGLTAPRDAHVVDGRGTRPLVIDGPFIETKEYIGGFWIIDAPDPATALTLATDASKACNRRLELRPFLR